MAITDSGAIKFSNEQIRPLSETMRNLYYNAKACQEDWFNGINALIPNDAGETLVDGRDDTLLPLTGVDINNIMTRLNDFITDMEVAGILDQIHKPCVRPLSG